MNEHEPDDGLLIAIEGLQRIQDRGDAHRSDPTGTSAGDDGDNRDGSPVRA